MKQILILIALVLAALWGADYFRAPGANNTPVPLQLTTPLTPAEATDTKSDKGEGNVTIKASFAQTQDATLFSVSLDTHSENLDMFKPNEQVFLQDKSGNKLKPQNVTKEGSGHHQQFIITFPRTEPPFSLVVENLANIPQRRLTWDK